MKKLHLTFIDYLFVGIVAVLILASYLSYQRLEGLVAASRLVNNSSVVKLKTEQAFSYLKDAETSQRGFLLTQDSSYLEPFFGAFDSSDQLFNQILLITREDSVQQQNVKNLQALIRVRYDQLNIILRVNDSTDAHVNLSPYLSLAKSSMNQIRIRVNEIIKLENEHLAESIEERNHYASISPLFLLSLTIFTLAISFVAFYKIKADTAHLKQLVEDLRERDTELTAKNEELENSNTELSSFSYVASHDLKEPLRKIQLFTDRIMENESQNLSATGKEDFKRIISAVVRMQNLFDALLSFSRANSPEKTTVPTDLNATLTEAKLDLKDLIEEKKVTIESVKLPTVKVVPIQFHQLFLNLIGNAIKYSKEDVRPHIKITTTQVVARGKQKAGWEISFADNGIGFEQQFEPKIFQLFQRLHGKSEYSGTGIGLAICKKIMSNHGGYIRASGEPGVGSVFTIFIPQD